MRGRGLRAGLFFLFSTFCFLVQAEELSASQLVSELRKGGYVLYLRHTSTDFSQNDASMTSYEDCASQRNLTDKGRDEARAIAGHIKRLGIPIGKVFASPFCRTVETAMLAFGNAAGEGQEHRHLQPPPAGQAFSSTPIGQDTPVPPSPQ